MKCKSISSRVFSSVNAARSGEGGAPSIPNLTHVKRFYKKVDVVEHPRASAAPTLTDDDSVTMQNLSRAQSYYAIALDGRVAKTLYKDDFLIPSKSLAVALAEEWDMQGEKVDLKSLKMNQMMAKAVRMQHDEALLKWTREQLLGYLIDDEICYQADP